MKYTVIVNDNFHAMAEGEGESYTEGEFDNAEGAIACAKEIVDKSLMGVYRQIMQQQPAGIALTTEGLGQHFRAFGETPYVHSDDESVIFHGWKYAEQRCEEIINERTDK